PVDDGHVKNPTAPAVASTTPHMTGRTPNPCPTTAMSLSPSPFIMVPSRPSHGPPRLRPLARRMQALTLSLMSLLLSVLMLTTTTTATVVPRQEFRIGLVYIDTGMFSLYGEVQQVSRNMYTAWENQNEAHNFYVNVTSVEVQGDIAE